MEGRQTKGKQKVEMKKMEESNSLRRSFSKRKAGIYKKANELVTRTGAEVGVLIFSPNGKPFSYAQPSLESITNRFMNQNAPQGELEGDEEDGEIEELTKKHNELLDRLAAERDREKVLEEQMTNMKNHGQAWWDTLAEEIGNGEAKKREDSFMSLHRAAMDQLKEKTFGASSAAKEGHSDA